MTRPGLEGLEKPVADHLPKVDPAAQETRLHYWQDVLHKLDGVPRAQLSPEEQINYDVYRPEIENAVADEKFRDFEMPANSDSAFWSDLGETARRPFKTLTETETGSGRCATSRAISANRSRTCERDLPAASRLRARLCRDAKNRSPRLRTANPKAILLYTPFREPMVGVQQSDQDKLKSEAAKVIGEIVQPAYADLLKFFRDEYVPKTRTTLAAEDCRTEKHITARKFASSSRSIYRQTRFTRSASLRWRVYISRWSTRCMSRGSKASFRNS